MDAQQERRFVIEHLVRFLDGTGDGWEYDDLVHMRFEDPSARIAIERLTKVPADYPATKDGYFCSEEGFSAIRMITSDLRDADAAGAIIAGD